MMHFPHSPEGVNYAEIDAKDPETLTEEEKIALLGRPRLGDITKISIRIKESKEFKVKQKRTTNITIFTTRATTDFPLSKNRTCYFKTTSF